MFSPEQVNGFQDLLAPLEFFILSIAVAVSIFLAVVVYVKKPKSATNKIFFLLGITAALWLISSTLAGLCPSFPWNDCVCNCEIPAF